MGSSAPRVRRVVIMGAAGRDFHVFDTVYRDDPETLVVAFTATQIPGIAGRRYPGALAGDRYPDGIPIRDEAELESICAEHAVDRVVFAYSDVSHAEVMHVASRALACGADFVLHGPASTTIRVPRPVIAVCAARTGCGKSQVTRWIASRAARAGRRVAVLRHPMPYGDLVAQRVQRFAAPSDLVRARCTAEEREEYEPLIDAGHVVYAGVDYAAIAAQAADEADLLLWDGGNNDFSFLAPDLSIALVDALRPDQVDTHHPGEAVVRMADVVIVAKADVAPPADVERALAAVARVNARARRIRGASPVRLDDATAVRGRRVLVVEDGPTLTHGGMDHGAGAVAARAAGAAELVDPRPHASPPIAAAFARYPHIGPVLPALGYGPEQLAALRATIEATPAEVVVSATPCDLAALIAPSRPVVRARYDYAELDDPGLGAIVDAFLARHPPGPGMAG
ncbi:MAG: GTPase [Ectothiorhodospiraceae bacterium]|nr:GTPase [Chromatiales bacterium]MCP5154369.1 GTPase [Ectothiorhodospiraceae bacterium]